MAAPEENRLIENAIEIARPPAPGRSADAVAPAKEISRPQISVVIPTCHRNEQLAACLDRLAPGKQNLSSGDYEVIVTDDGSKSTAEAMIRERYPWARWVAGPRMGPASNRNNGARNASGDWLVFTDDDCVPAPGWLLGYASGKSAHTAEAYEGKTICSGVCTALYDAPINEDGGCFWSCNIMMRKSLFDAIGGFNTTFRLAADEDTDLRERLKQRGLPIVFLESAIVDHPPQPRRRGAQAGRYRESQVQMWYLTGQTQSMRSILIKRTIVETLHRIKDFPLGPDSFRVAVSLFGELSYVLRHLRNWENEYRKMYEGTTPPYPYPYR